MVKFKNNKVVIIALVLFMIGMISMVINTIASTLIHTQTFLGDANGDGEVTSIDARLVLQFAAGMKNYSDSEIAIADMNNDGKISAIDARLVLQTAVGLKELEELLPSTTVLDSGKCGDNLNWELLSDGTLHIFGAGRMYDYIKYTEPSPWYKYREEPYISEDGKMILNSDGTEYLPTTDYYADNPNNYKIKRIMIDEGVTYIGDWAFYRVCVEELTLPEGVEETGYFCIRYSPTLKRVNLPDSLKFLDDYAISRNYVLEEIDFGSGLEKIGRAGLMTNHALKKAIFPDSLKEINVAYNTSYTGSGSVDNTNVGLMEGCYSLKEVSLGSVDSVPQSTFMNTAIENIIIPNTASYVGKNAFRNCTALKTVVFEENSNCTLIQSYAFGGCSSLTSITGCVAVESIEANAFNGCTSLKEYEFSDANKEFSSALFYKSPIECAKIGPNVTVVPKSIFQYSMIKKIYISNSVVEIQSAALHSCNSLTDIYYDGTKEEWNTIIKATNWAHGGTKNNCIVHFNDGTTVSLASVC